MMKRCLSLAFEKGTYQVGVYSNTSWEESRKNLDDGEVGNHAHAHSVVRCRGGAAACSMDRRPHVCEFAAFIVLLRE